MQRTCLFGSSLLLCVVGATMLHAQSAADRELIQRARSLYYSPVSRPHYIACDSAVDWDAVAKQDKVPSGAGYRLGFELVKAMKVSFVTRGSKHTDVHVTADTRIPEQQQQAQQMITAFFARYWDTADGRFLPSATTDYQLIPNAEGYLITQQKEGIIASVQVNALLLITRATGHDLQTTEDLVVTPTFRRENDGLLHLSGLSVDDTLGERHRSITYQFDYQQVGGFFVPQHVTMSLPGVVSYPHTFSNCQVFDKNNAPPRVSASARP